MTVKILISGICGKMGKRIAYLSAQDEDIKLVGGIETSDSSCIGMSVGSTLGVEKDLGIVKESICQIEQEWDVYVDFSAPEATLSHIEEVVNAKKAAVIGTTGFSQTQEQKLLSLASLIPSVIAPNMSVGVNVLFSLLKDITGVLGSDYDIELYETHHRFKKDAPSGTAKKMAEIIAGAAGLDNSAFVYGRKGITGERPSNIIGIHSLRGGDVVGEHTVVYAWIGERVEITHRAHSRDTFAAGALRAVKFIFGKTPGIYTMAQVLGLE
jgi:4-hydroxy-tetrahydrodipicolinate reductase